MKVLRLGSATGKVAQVHKPITTRSVSEVQLVPRLRFGLEFAQASGDFGLMHCHCFKTRQRARIPSCYIFARHID